MPKKKQADSEQADVQETQSQPDMEEKAPAESESGPEEQEPTGAEPAPGEEEPTAKKPPNDQTAPAEPAPPHEGAEKGGKESVAEPIGPEALDAAREKLTLGHYSAAQEHLAKALTAFQESKDDAGVGASLLGLGIVALFQGDYDTAEVNLERAIAIHRQLGDALGQVDALEQLGLLHTLRGRPGPSLAAYQQAKELCQNSHD